MPEVSIFLNFVFIKGSLVKRYYDMDLVERDILVTQEKYFQNKILESDEREGDPVL